MLEETMKFASFTKDYLSFKNYKNNGLNGICSYPAMMVDEMQRALILKVLDIYPIKKNVTLLDPFHGAGTTLLIAQELGINQIGFDINPLANLITKAKMQSYDESLQADFIRLQNTLQSENVDFEIIEFESIKKWFRSDIIENLSKIRFSIEQIKNDKNRLLFWAIFSNIVRKYSNSRSSTFKLHIKEPDKIKAMPNDCITQFLKEVADAIIKVNYKENDLRTEIKCGNSIQLIDEIKDETIDIICTSPPYGDNQTTVTYGQFSSLQLRWINKDDLDVYDKIVDKNYSSIDRASLGGTKREATFDLDCITRYLDNISDNKKQKVKNFVIDYSDIFLKLSKKIKKDGFLVLTVGNRKVDNQLFPFVAVNDELASKFGLEKVVELNRDIFNKRMAKKISNVNNNSVESMSEEYILIYKKSKEEQKYD